MCELKQYVLTRHVLVSSESLNEQSLATIFYPWKNLIEHLWYLYVFFLNMLYERNLRYWFIVIGQANSDTMSNRSILNGGVRARVRLHGSENTAPSVTTPSSHRNNVHLPLPASTGSCFLQGSSLSPLNLPYPIQPERTTDTCSIGRVGRLTLHLHLACIKDAACVKP